MLCENVCGETTNAQHQGLLHAGPDRTVLFLAWAREEFMLKASGGVQRLGLVYLVPPVLCLLQLEDWAATVGDA